MEDDVEHYGNEKNTEEPTGFHDERGVRASEEEMAWPEEDRGLAGEFPPNAVSDDPDSLDPSTTPILPDGTPVHADADSAGAGSSRGPAQGA